MGATKAPRKSSLGPLFGEAEIPARARAGRPILRAAEHRAGGGHQSAPKKRLGTAIRGYENAGLPCYICEQVDEKSV